MKIGIVGFGSIAKRVYLPLYLNNKDISEIHIYSRNRERLEKDLKHFNFKFYDDFNLLLSKVDVLMVHSATVSHYAYIKKALIARVPVYVDKPLSDEVNKSKELIKIAKDNNTLLFIGYNRRYAPLYQIVKNLGLKPYKILYEKHRAQLTLDEDYKTAIIDDFIHVVDTVVDFNESQLKVSKTVLNITENDELVSLYVDLSTKDQINTLFTSRNSSNDFEKVTFFAPDKIVVVENMRVLKILQDNVETITKISERLSDSQIRGFENALNNFFLQVKDNHYIDSKQMNSEVLCDEIILDIENNKI